MPLPTFIFPITNQTKLSLTTSNPISPPLPPLPHLLNSPHTTLSPNHSLTLPPIHLCPNITLDPCIVLSPMAGVTTYPFRHLCNHHGATLTVSEMLHSSMLSTPTTLHKAIFSAGTSSDPIPSAQLYGTDPSILASATRALRARHVRHIDLNLGCPAPKALRAGAGAAIPANLPLLTDIVNAVVHAAQDVPVTAKMRIGVFGNFTYLQAAQILQQQGVSAIVLHTRTAEQMYQKNTARDAWYHIERLKQVVDIPVIGNGDVFTALDAVEMIMQTGADGVAIGRGCLGRPWLFEDVRMALSGQQVQTTVPIWKDVARTMLWHLHALLLTQTSVMMTNGEKGRQS